MHAISSIDIIVLAALIAIHFFLPFVPLLKLRKGIHGSDHYYHVLIIDLIRDNNHRFITRNDCFLLPSLMAYPQLVHWLLSWFPGRWLPAISRILPPVFNILGYVSFSWFTLSIYPKLENYVVFSSTRFLMLATLIYVLTPYTYNLENAKNSGISARGLGLLLGQTYLYALTLFVTYNSPHYLFVAGTVVVLIFLSSQFAAQFVVFSAPILALYYLNYWFIVTPFVSAALFFLFFPVTAKQFFVGQVRHKSNYSRFLAPLFILKSRYSIWRDWVYDFWVMLRSGATKASHKMAYIGNNPLFIILIEMPFFVALVPYFLSHPGLFSPSKSPLLYCLAGPVIVGLILFLLTSFRKTRFLGEPERYLEFSFGLVALLFVIFYSDSIVISVLPFLASVLIAFKLFVYIKFKSRGNVQDQLVDIRRDLTKLASEGVNVRLLANDVETARMLSNKYVKVFSPSWLTESEGSFHIKDMFRYGYPLLDKEILPAMIDEFNVTFFIVDTRTLPDYQQIISRSKHKATKVMESGSYKVYRIWSEV